MTCLLDHVRCKQSHYPLIINWRGSMSKTILVVDDSGTFRQVVNMALTKAGYTVIEAVDGRDACTKLAAPKLDLIICDINMPHMDGIEFARRAKASAHKFTPILMITTESRSEIKAEGPRRPPKLPHLWPPKLLHLAGVS